MTRRETVMSVPKGISIADWAIEKGGFDRLVGLQFKNGPENVVTYRVTEMHLGVVTGVSITDPKMRCYLSDHNTVYPQ